MDTALIPKQFLMFIPRDSAFCTGLPHWVVKQCDLLQSVSVERQKLFPMQSVLIGIFLFVISMAILISVNIYNIHNHNKSLLVLNLMGTAVSFVMLLGVPGGYAVATHANSRYWKGSLYFKYKPDTQELFFPRENQLYRQSKCKCIILGCVSGYDTRRMTKVAGISMSGGRSRQFTHNTILQCFVLVLLDTDKWVRHEIGYDLPRSKIQFDNLVKILQPLVYCNVFFKHYSFQECYSDQR